MGKKSGKLEKILRFKPRMDFNKGRYVSFCDYGYHQGVIRFPGKCEVRRCRHYHRLYIPNEGLLED